MIYIDSQIIDRQIGRYINKITEWMCMENTEKQMDEKVL